MEVKTEPAGRLFDIFKEARTKPATDSSRKVWSSIFGVPENETGTILKMLADLIQLTHETKAKIEQLDDIDHQLYLKPFTKIEQILSKINLDAGWQQWKDQIDETTIYGLQICSDKLNRITNYTKIKNDELDKIRKSLAELTDMVLEADLHTSLKQLLIRNLERLRQSLISYRIKGIEGIEQEVALNFGSVLLYREEIREKTETDENKTLWQRYFSFLSRLNIILATAKNIKQLTGEEIIKLIGIGNG